MAASVLPIVLCLVSAVTVAATNLFVKKGGDVLATRMVVSLAMAATALPVAFFVPLPSAEVWAALAIALCAHGIYQFSMVRALHRGDLSLVFPVMRGLAPLMTAFLGLIFLDEYPGQLGWFGLMVASAALIAFAWPERLEVNPARLRQTALFWAVLTAAGIGAYSVADANGARKADSILTYIVWLFLLDWIGITAAVLLARRRRAWSDVRTQIRDGTIGGLLGSVSYGTALWAFTLTDAATVTALRETSVVFGAIFGAALLKEPFGRRRIVAAGLLALGLCLLEFAT